MHLKGEFVLPAAKLEIHFRVTRYQIISVEEITMTLQPEKKTQQAKKKPSYDSELNKE